MPANIEVARSIYRAFAQGDVGVLFAAFDDGIVWEEPPSAPYGSHAGRDAVFEEVFPLVMSHLDGFAGHPEEWIDGGDTVVVLGRYRGRSRATGAELDTPFIHVWRFNEGKVTGFRTSYDTHHWREVIGEGNWS